MNGSASTARIGVAELRGRLSHYLKQAHLGRRLLVTDHGEPLAEIVPLNKDPESGVKIGLKEKLRRLAEEGFINYPTGTGWGTFKRFKPVAVGAPGECIASRMIVKDREESW